MEPLTLDPWALNPTNEFNRKPEPTSFTVKQLEADREAMRRKGRYALLRLEYLSKLTDLSARRHRRIGSFFTQIVNKQVPLLSLSLPGKYDNIRQSRPDSGPGWQVNLLFLSSSCSFFARKWTPPRGTRADVQPAESDFSLAMPAWDVSP